MSLLAAAQEDEARRLPDCLEVAARRLSGSCWVVCVCWSVLECMVDCVLECMLSFKVASRQLQDDFRGVAGLLVCVRVCWCVLECVGVC